MDRMPFRKALSLYLILALLALSFPAHGWAMFLPATVSQYQTSDRARIQATLESSLIKQRLMDYGLSPEETAAKLNTLTDDQIHRLAAQMDSLQPGGSIVGDVIFLLLVVLIVIVVLEATGHQIIIKR